MNNIESIIISVLYKSIDITKVQDRISHLIMMLSISTETNTIENLFMELEAIHFVLSKYQFEYKMDLNDTLVKFVRNFERIDDSRNRQYLLKEIKNGKLKY